MRRTLLSLVLAAAIAGACGWAFTERRERLRQAEAFAFERRQAALVAEENGRLRAAVEKEARTARLRREMAARADVEKVTARLRELPFNSPVHYKTLKRAEVKAVLGAKLAEQFSDPEFEKMRLGYTAFGLLPEGYRLKQKYLELLGEQVAAFYDQHAHQLFMFDHATLDSAQNRMILAHELTHALQDQHYSLARLPLELKNNDDRALAASALVEGDATILMNLYLVENLSLKAVAESVQSAFFQNVEALQAAPRLLRESLLFPYLEGAKFCMALQERGDGFGALAAVYARPPSSTSQILHPEKYIAREEPVAIDWPSLTVKGEAPLADNVLGEFGVRVLFAEWVDEAAAPALAQGWRGDRYLVFDGGRALVWRTAWESPDRAAAFAGAARKMWEKRYGAKALSPLEDRTPPRVALAGKGRQLRIVYQSATEVTLIDAPDEPWAELLETQFTGGKPPR